MSAKQATVDDVNSDAVFFSYCETQRTLYWLFTRRPLDTYLLTCSKYPTTLTRTSDYVIYDTKTRGARHNKPRPVPSCRCGHVMNLMALSKSFGCRS